MVKEKKQSVKDEIKKAFLQMLSQKDYIDITISDLVNKAQVARMSFYRNFNSMNDVIDSIVDDRIREFNIDIVPLIKENDEQKWRELIFEILYRSIQIKKANRIDFEKKHANYKVIMDRLHEKMLMSEYEIQSKTHVDKYIAIGKMSLLHGIIDEWEFSGMKETPEEMVNIILPIIMKF